MHDTTSWRGAYARLAGQLVGADPLIGREEIAERLSVPVDDLDRILDIIRLPRSWSAGGRGRLGAAGLRSKPKTPSNTAQGIVSMPTPPLACPAEIFAAPSRRPMASYGARIARPRADVAPRG